MKKFMIVLLLALIIAIGFIGIHFGTAFFQENNTTEILTSIAKLEFYDREYVQVNETSQRIMYVSKNKMGSQGKIIKEYMKQREWRFVEQMGAGYLFEKDSLTVVVDTRLFTGNYTIWTVPLFNKKLEARAEDQTWIGGSFPYEVKGHHFYLKREWNRRNRISNTISRKYYD